MIERLVTDLPLKDLFPIQGGLMFDAGQELGEELTDGPIATMVYEPATEARDATYLILDGHHRALRAYALERTAISSEVLTSDEHIRASRLPSVRWFNTMEEVKECYRTIWLPRVKERGVTNIASLSTRLLFAGQHEAQRGCQKEESMIDKIA